MTEFDSHKVRMVAGSKVMATLDSLDDELIAKMIPAQKAMQALAADLREKGIGQREILIFLIGCCIPAAIDE